MPHRRSSIRVKTEASVVVRRAAITTRKLVYVLLASRPLPVQHPGIGRSRICYIGTTRRGIARVSESVAQRSGDILAEHGVHELEAHLLTATPRRHVRTWLKLERALLVAFRQRFGATPLCNDRRAGKVYKDERDYFAETRLNSIIDDLSRRGE